MIAEHTGTRENVPGGSLENFDFQWDVPVPNQDVHALLLARAEELNELFVLEYVGRGIVHL